MRRLPVLRVIISPLTFEPLFVAVLHPKFRFLEMDRFRAGFKCSSDTHTEISAIIRSGTHIINAATVTVRSAVAIGLLLIFVVHPIETPAQVILVLPPGDTSHHVDTIAVPSPGLDAIRKVGSDAVSDG